MKTPAPTILVRFQKAAIRVLVTLLAVLFTNPGLAAQVNAGRAASAARGWLRTDRTPLAEKLSNQIQRVECFKDKAGDISYYVVYLHPAGFVIVAADDLVEPIIAFAREGTFDPSLDNPLGALVSNDVPGRVARARLLGAAALQDHSLRARQKWQWLEASDQTDLGVESVVTTVSDVRVAPFVVSRWSQSTVSGSACYNFYSPPYTAGDATNYVCGCVATAMAQLIRYHQHPTAGVGTASLLISVDGVPTWRNLRGGDGSGGPYSWADMPLTPIGPTTTQRQAIGALTHDAGVSVNMNYTFRGSGTDTLLAKDGLVNTFGYSCAIKGFNAGINIGSGLNAMINPNLDARYPVLLGITGGPGGHAIVCDGYGYSASTLYHHLNLGWSGMDDAWYALPTVGTSQGTFTSVYKCLYNVFVAGSGEIISGRVVDASGAAVAGASVTATCTSGGTYTTTTDVKGIYALAKIPSATQYAISVSKSGYSSANGTYSTGTSMDYRATSGNVWAANFTLAPPNNALLTVLVSPSNGGTVSGGGTYPAGSQTQICATPHSGWSFAKWQDGVTTNPRTVAVPAGGATYTATFTTTPWFSAITQLANGQMQLTLVGAPMSTYLIHFSSDLKTWKTLTTVTVTNGSVAVLDPTTGPKQCFYRAMLAP